MAIYDYFKTTATHHDINRGFRRNTIRLSPRMPTNLDMDNNNQWIIERSVTAKFSANPIRIFVDRLKVPTNPEVQPPMILNLGDPSLYGNLPPPENLTDVISKIINSHCGQFIPPSIGNINSLTDHSQAYDVLPCENSSTAQVDRIIVDQVNSDEQKILLPSFEIGSSPHGYPPAIGTSPARESVAKHANKNIPNTVPKYNGDDVVICSGCSGAIDIAITVLAGGNDGAVVLIPSPGFTLYKTLCDSKQITSIAYPLLPTSDWEVDLAAAERIIESNQNIKAWIINNPSNPCGSVYSIKHLQSIKTMALKYKIPIIADEVYEDMVFEPNQYFPMASVEPLESPVITCSGLAKRFLVPGWRVGWILFSPACGNILDDVRAGVADLACLLLGANSLIQAAIPQILENVPDSFHIMVNSYLANNAHILYNHLMVDAAKTTKDTKHIGCLPITINCPQGSMYSLIGLTPGFYDFEDDVVAAQLLISEESVKVLPGSVSYSDCSHSPSTLKK